MAIGQRIKFIRNLRNQTQKWLGLQVGFPERAADVRITQYETGNRTPKSDMVEAIANKLDVNPMALDIPPIESDYGFIHTLFAFEDLFGLQVAKKDDEICIKVNNADIEKYRKTSTLLRQWYDEYQKFLNGETTKEEYDNWRYNYPQSNSDKLKAAVDVMNKVGKFILSE
jgi:transcriptional regulator with XRE-family HTH domain